MQVQCNPLRIYESLIKYEERVEVDDKIIQFMEEYLEKCIAAGANIHHIADGVQGDTMLHRAVKEGKVCVATALLNKGANPDALNLSDKTPRQLASNKHDLKKLFPVKNEESRRVFEFTTVSPDPQSYFKAIKKGNREAVEFFIKESGPNVLFFCDDQGRTALHIAAMMGHDDIVQCLLKTNLESEIKDKEGRTALFLAAQNGHKATVKLLLERCGGRNDTDRAGNTPLHLAAQQGHLEVVSLLAVSSNNEHISASIKLRNLEGKRPIDIGSPDVQSFLKFLEELENKTQ